MKTRRLGQLFWILTLISSLGLTACNGPKDVDNFLGIESLGTVGNSALSITPDKYDFGPALAGGSPLTITMTLTNTTSNFSLSILSIGGVSDPNFSVTTDCPMGGNTLAPKSTCTAQIAFHPVTGGDFQYNVVVDFSAGSGSPSPGGTTSGQTSPN